MLFLVVAQSAVAQTIEPEIGAPVINPQIGEPEIEPDLSGDDGDDTGGVDAGSADADDDVSVTHIDGSSGDSDGSSKESESESVTADDAADAEAADGPQSTVTVWVLLTIGSIALVVLVLRRFK